MLRRVCASRRQCAPQGADPRTLRRGTVSVHRRWRNSVRGRPRPSTSARSVPSIAQRNGREERRIESDRPSDRTQSGHGGGEVPGQPPERSGHGLGPIARQSARPRAFARREACRLRWWPQAASGRRMTHHCEGIGRKWRPSACRRRAGIERRPEQGVAGRSGARDPERAGCAAAGESGRRQGALGREATGLALQDRQPAARALPSSCAGPDLRGRIIEAVPSRSVNPSRARAFATSKAPQRRCRVRQIPRPRSYGRYRRGRVGTGRATSRPRPGRAPHRRAFGSPVSSADARPRRASTESSAPRPQSAMTRHARTLELGVKGTETVPFATVTRYADSSWSPIGRLRIRLPVASWIALTSAGAYGGTPGSPTPHGRRCAKSSTMCTRTSSGASLMRVIG